MASFIINFSCKKESNEQNWIAYKTTEGLAFNMVNSIAIDAKGNKWFGTPGGVSKFDGTNWINYTTADGLADNRVYCITYNENSRFDVIQTITIDSHGNKWFGTWSGVWKFDNANWTRLNYLSFNYVYAIAIDAQDNKWFGTDNGVSKYDGTNWTTYKKVDGLARTNYNMTNGLAHNIVNTIATDGNGNLWFGSNGGGISKFDGTKWSTYKINDKFGNFINTITIDAQGNKWFGTFNGVYEYLGN